MKQIVEVFDKTSTIVKKDSVRYTYQEQYIYGVPLMLEIGVLHFEVGDLTIGSSYSLSSIDGKIVNLTYCGVSREVNTRVTNQATTQLIFMPSIAYRLVHNLYNNGDLCLGVEIDDYINGGSNLLDVFIFTLRTKGLVFKVNDDFTITKVFNLKYRSETSYTLPAPVKIKEIKVNKSSKQNYCATETKDKSRTKNGIGLPMLLLFKTKSDVEILDNFIVPRYENEYSVEVIPNVGQSVIFKQEKMIICEKIVALKGASTKTILVLGSIK